MIDGKRILVTISTKGRTHTTLPYTLFSIINQTLTPDELVVYDDNTEFVDLRNDPVYRHIFAMLDFKKIAWSVLPGQRRGQVANHSHALSITQCDFIWRIDDDNVAQPTALEEMMKVMTPEVAAVAPLAPIPNSILYPKPSTCTGKLSNGMLDMSTPQWYDLKEDMEVEHLHNTFVYDVEKARQTQGYLQEGSPVGHREETIFTHRLWRKFGHLKIAHKAIVWHLHSDSGGIRSYRDPKMYEYDEERFLALAKSEWGYVNEDLFVIPINHAVGDHIMYLNILPDLRYKYRGKKIVIACHIPELFTEDWYSVVPAGEAERLIGRDKVEELSPYRWMVHNNWRGHMIDALRRMYDIA